MITTNLPTARVGGRRRRRSAPLALLTAVAVLAAACGGDDNASDGTGAAEEAATEDAVAEDAVAEDAATEDAAAEPAATEPAAPADEPVTLTISDQLTVEGPSAALDALIEAYMAQNPNVTIERESQAFDDYQSTLRLRASSEDGPDIIEMNVMPGGLLAQMVRADLVRELDDYDAQYGWSDRLPAGLLNPSRFSSDGKVEGTGSLFGVPTGQAEVVGVYYNKALLAQIGLEVPTTFDEFEAALAAAAEAGIAPLVVGGLDAWPWGMVYMALSNTFNDDPSAMIEWSLGAPDTTYDTPGNRRAAEVLRSWMEAGYFIEGVEGLTFEGEAAAFADGQALFNIQGPWANAGHVAGLGEDVGFFLFPSLDGAASPRATGSPGWSFGITRVSQHPDEAAAFLDFVTQPENRAFVLAAEIPPAYPGEAEGIDPGSTLSAIIEGYNAATEANALVPYHDNAFPYDPNADFYAGFQQVAGGQFTAEQFVTYIQDGWVAFHESLAE